MVAKAELRAVVCTGSLDLGIDWGDVDLVMCRSERTKERQTPCPAHRTGEPPLQCPLKSRCMVPANRFEIVECIAALARGARRAIWMATPCGPGPRDVLCQHILIVRALPRPVRRRASYTPTVRSVGAYRKPHPSCLSTPVSTFCATGGYALRAYDQLAAPSGTA